MGKLVVEMTMSLDGFISGPDVRVGQPLGLGGERLHEWLFSPDNDVDREATAAIFDTSGAVLMGRRVYDTIEGWGDEDPFGRPCFVVTQRAHEVRVRGATTYTFVTDGIANALEQARAAAGEKDVTIMGGADLAQQFIEGGLVDELRIHVAPVLFGAGTRLFDLVATGQAGLELTRCSSSPKAAHLRFAFRR
ncbi:MAG TPA: dihydrofolate reductase family protein [Microbacteriaceae bacterium]|nr:dihydrofolate reductase family protein [Microbacteriaceae bacterium]